MIVRRKSTLEGTVRKLARGGLSAPAAPLALPLGAWSSPTLLNSWVNYGAGQRKAGYKLNAIGKVELRGLVKRTPASTAGFTTPIFILPAGLRPTENEVLMGHAVLSGVSKAVRVDATAGGEVLVGETGVYEYLSLAGIAFYPD
jgi:hypothetical protein